MEKCKNWYFENSKIFEGFTPNQLIKLANQVRIKSYKKDEYIYIPNELSDKMFLIKEGSVKVGTYSQDGRVILKSELRRGELFGEMSLTSETTRNDFAQALEELEVCVFDLNLVEKMVEINPKLSLTITKIVGFRLRKIENKLAALMFKDAQSRIIDFLKEQADNYGSPVGTETLIWNKLTHRDIASLTATSRQTVTTVLNKLRSQNLIYFDRKRILIRDVEKLVYEQS